MAVTGADGADSELYTLHESGGSMWSLTFEEPRMADMLAGGISMSVSGTPVQVRGHCND